MNVQQGVERGVAGKDVAPVFAGPGALRARCREVDWAATALGPVESWDSALRAAVRFCLNSSTATAVWAGPEQRLIYNDRYAAVLGPHRHPWALGRPGHEVCAQLSDRVASQVENGSHGGKSTEQGLSNHSITPIQGDRGGILGALDIVPEAAASAHGLRRALRAAESRLHKATSTPTVGVLFFSLDGKIQGANAAFERMCGYSSDELRSTAHWKSLTDPQFWTATADAAERLASTGETAPYEKQMIRKDGARWWGLFAPTVLAGAGTSAECMEFVVDVTERKHADKRLQESEEQQRLLLELSDAIRFLDDPEEIQFVACRVIGQHLGVDRVLYTEIRDDGEAVVLRDWATGAPLNAAQLRVSVWGTSVVSTLRRGETLVIDDAAHDPRLEESSRRTFVAAGIGASIGLGLVKGGRWVATFGVHSVTPRVWTASEIALVQETAERTWAAVERGHAERARRASEARYRSLFESIDEGFCIIEVLFDGESPVDYRILEVNPTFERQTGLENARGQRARELVPALEEQRFQTYGRVVLTGEPARFQSESNALGRVYDVYAFRIGPSGEHRVAILFNDVTDRRRFEQQLQESDRRKDEFLAMLGHELRNPLAAIRSATDLLKVMATDDARLRRIQGVLERQSAHMTRLIDGLLEVSRIARGKIQLDRETLDARVVVEALLQDRISQYESRGVRLIKELPSEPVWVCADRVRLTQVFDNLLGNAIKFTPSGGTVRVRVGAQEGAAVIGFRDTGIGIRPDMLAHVFEPFQQEIQGIDRKAGGLGLGLAVARGLVELHGGRIRAHSAGLGKGAEFEVRLALAPAPADEPRSGSTEQAEARRVIVVEDNPDAAETLSDLLELAGHEVTIAEDGRRALELLRSRGADIVLCDLGLPGMSGFEFAQAVRRDPAIADVPLVAVTGYGQPEDRRRSANAGFDEHLTKPVDIGAVHAVIARLSFP